MPPTRDHRSPLARRARVRLLGCVLAAAFALLLAPSSSSGHPGHPHAVYGPPPPPGLWDGAASARDASAQARFARELLELPAERDGACSDTEPVDGVGRACRTDDGLLRVPQRDGTDLLTHGPDFLEAATDIDPAETAPYITAAVQSASKADVACVPSTQAHTLVVFAMPADAVDRSATQLAALRQAVYETSAVIDARARSLAPTASRKLRVTCTGSGDLAVTTVRLPHTQAQAAAASNGMSLVRGDVQAALGHDSATNVRYLVYYDAHLAGYAGIGSYYQDNTAAADNDNNRNGAIALQDDSWGTGPRWDVLLHELTHTMGAVLDGAPDANEVGHCNDGLDVMCYAEPSTPGVQGTYTETQCTELHYDCAGDSYFNPAPTGGSWLDTHWNAGHARNRFLRASAVAADTTPPAQVTGLTGTAHGDFVRLSWDAVADADLHAYRVERDTGGGTWRTVADSWPGETTLDATWTGLVSNTTVTLRVRAFDRRGNLGTPSASFTTSTGAYDSESASVAGTAPDDPGNVVASATTASSVTLRWTASHQNIDFYEIDRWNGSSWSYRGYTYADTTTYTDCCMAGATQQRYRVRAIDSQDRSSSGAEVRAWTTTAPDTTAPATPGTFAVASSSGNAPNLTWGAVGDAVAYSITTAPATSTTWVTGTSAQLGGLAHATTYTISLRAKDEAGNLSTAATTTFTTPALGDVTAPTETTVPVSCAGSVTKTSVPLTWIPSAFSDDVGVVSFRPVAVPSSGSWDFVAGNLVVGTATTSGTVTGLRPGTTYDVWLVAYDAAGRSVRSSYYCPRTTSADAANPTTPANLTVTDTSQDSVDLSWSASSDDAAVAGYNVYRTSPGPTQLLGTVEHPTTTFTATGLTPLTGYTFAVEAIDVADKSSSQASVSTTTASSDTTPPSVPSSLSVDAVAGTSVDLSWAAATDDVAVTGYEVRQGSAAGPVLAATTGTSTTVTGLDDATTYTLALVARDAAGNRSAAATTSVTTLDVTAPSTPSGLGTSSVTGSSFTATWNASSDNAAVDHYLVRRNGSPVASVAGTSHASSGLDDATTYTVEVAAVDVAGNTSAYASVDVTTLDTTAPAAPTTPTVQSLTDVRTTIAWSAATDNVAVTGYRVYDTTAPGTPAATSTTTSALVTGLSPSTGYSFHVTAIDAAGNESPASSTVSLTTEATPDTTAPTAPGSFTASDVTTAGMRLSWSAASDPSGVAGYDLQRNDGSGWIAAASGLTTLQYDATGLAQGTTYSWRVSALDGAGNRSDWSTTSATTVLGPDTSAPSTPPGALGTSSPGAGIVDLAWGASVDDRGVAGYRVYRNAGAGWFLVATTTATSTRLLGQPAGQTVNYSVIAFDAAGNTSGSASAGVYVQAPPPPAPAPIAPVAGVSAVRTPTSLQVAWLPQDSRATSYRVVVRQGTSTVATRTTNSTSVIIAGLVPRRTYEVDVVTIASSGESAATTLGTSTTADTARPSRPAWIRSRALARGRMRVWWRPARDNDRVVRYELRLLAPRTRARIVRTRGPQRIATVTRLRRGTRYVVQVRAVDRSGNRSSWTSTRGVSRRR